VHTKHSKRKFGTGANETQMQMEENDQYAQGHGHANGAYAGRTTADSQRTLGANDVRNVNGVKYEGQAPVTSNF